MRCPICGAESETRGRWRGYYRFRCAAGHLWKLATPEQAASNWTRLSAAGGTEAR